jgi:ATP-dependent Clp protease ATP-binding subunit ClpA
MFERYTEKARRVIFFARFEASQFGSKFIDTEHILLGLLREDPMLMDRALRGHAGQGEIRNEIERGIEKRERISTSVEVPLSQAAKRILQLAADEAAQLNNGYVGPEHLALGILRMPDSVAGRILTERGVTLEDFRKQVSRGAGLELDSWRLRQIEEATAVINAFLAGIGWSKWTDFSSYFAEHAQFVDSEGKTWIGREEIGRQFEALLLPYAKKGVTFILDSVSACAANTFMGSILWENVTVASGAGKSMHRMSILIEEKGHDRLVVFIQVTPLRIS